MPFSHHSHSGQFCGHASNTLEEMVQRAISLRMASFALTEHMPRSESSDLYPEEISAGQTGPGLFQLFDAFVTEAKRLRERYRPQIQILIGFEGEWIRPSFAGVMGDLMGRYEFDFFVGSVHHVHGVPIDFDHEMYYKARDISGGSDEALYRDYFDAQYAMLKALKPPVVGHFDLIRLKSDDPERSFETVDEAWTRILRNLEFVASYGGILELNSSALRKGMSEPYPKVEICKAFLKMQGRFTLADDSHDIKQVGLNYARVLESVEKAGIEHLVLFERGTGGAGFDPRFPTASLRSIKVEDLREYQFWKGG